jgi:hypothetical protein
LNICCSSKGCEKVLLLERLEQKPTRAFGLLKERE